MEKKIILQLRFYYYYYSVPVKSINSFIKRRWRWPGGEFVLCHSVMDGWEVRATTKVLKLPCCSPCTACSRYSFISVHARAYWHSSCFKCCHEREIWRWAPSFTNHLPQVTVHQQSPARSPSYLRANDPETLSVFLCSIYPIHITHILF